MSDKNIILLVFGLLLAILFVAFVLYGGTRKGYSQETSGGKTHFLTRSWQWAFGSRKASHFESPEEALYHSPNRWVLNVFFVVLLLGALAYMNLDLHLIEKLTSSVPKWNSINFTLGQVFSPDWDFFWGRGDYRFKEGVVFQVFQTFGIAYIGTLIASVLALPFGILASHKLFGKWAWVSEIFLIIIRTFPELLLGILMVAYSGISPLTGVLAIGVHSVGMIGKLYAEQFDDVNMEPLEALAASGASAWQKVHLAVMPQARPGLYSVALYRFDINIRTATILGVVVGADCGIGFSISSLSSGSHWSKLGACIFGVVILIVIIDLFSAWLRKKIV
jgi:phosphonate transport system permease protein